MLEILKQPAEIGFSRNPIQFSVKADESIWLENNTSVTPTTYLQITNMTDVTIGRYIRITFGGVSVLFTCVENGAAINDSSASTFQAYNGQIGEDFLAQMSFFMQKNWYISRFFMPVLNNTTLEFSQLSKLFDGEIEIETDIPSATVTIVAAGVKPSFPDDYSIYAELYQFPKGRGFIKKVCEMQITPSTESPYTSDFNFEKIIDDLLEVVLPNQQTLQSNPTQPMLSQSASFQIRFTDVLNGLRRRLYVSTNFTVIKGGVDWQTYIKEPNWLTEANLPVGGNACNFLTNQPMPRMAHPGNVEYLYFFWKGKDGIANVTYMESFEDGNRIFTQVNIAVKKNQIHVIKAGLINHQPITKGIRKVIRAYVSISQEYPFVYSYEMKYVAHRICNHETNLFCFVNPLGGIDTIICSGDVTTAVKSDKEMLKRFWEWSPEGGISVYRKNTTQPMKTSTIYYDRDHAIWLREFFQATQVWHKTDIETFIPIIILNDTVTLVDGQNDTFRIQFEYQYAIEQ